MDAKSNGDSKLDEVMNSQDNLPPSHFWSRMKMKWNGGHQLLPTTDTPTISTSTTATNLSNLDFQSSTTINNILIRGALLEENLRTAIPEIEPLQTKPEMNSSQELESSDEQLCQKDKPRVAWSDLVRQVIAAIAVSWVSMVIGYTSGYTSPAGTSLKADLNITQFQFSWISGIMPLSALIGGLLGGPLIEYMGRKWTLLITNVLFLIGWTVNYFAVTYWYVYASRMISGCGVGIASLTLPVYLGETIQPEVRGTLGLLPTAFGNIGILICFLMGILLQWRGIAGVGALLSLPFLLMIWIIPETPRWYVSKGQNDKAREALVWLRGKANKETIDKEYAELVKTDKSSNEKNDNLWSIFTDKAILKSMVIVLGLMFFQQMSGINAVIFYTTEIFNDTGSDIDSSIQTTIVGVVNFVSTFVATILIDRLGRKVLLYISSVAMIITLGGLGTYFYLLKVAHMDVSSLGWVPLANFVVYVLAFSFGFGPVPWLMMGEILPAKIRGPAASVCTGFNWTCTFVVTTTFPSITGIIGPHGAFWMFGAITVLALVFTIILVPETRGQSLEDIERKLAGRTRRISSIANMKPLQSTF